MSYWDWQVKLFAEGACLADMLAVYQMGLAAGFVIEPVAVKAAGVQNYAEFVRRVAAQIPDLPLSFAIPGVDFQAMEHEARAVTALGANIYAKIPIINSRGESALPLIARLSAAGCKLDIALLFTLEQIQAVVRALAVDTPSLLSVCVGEIADTGVNPRSFMLAAAAISAKNPRAQLLWAECREIYQIIEADRVGCSGIVVPYAQLRKLCAMDKDLEACALTAARAYTQAAIALDCASSR